MKNSSERAVAVRALSDIINGGYNNIVLRGALEKNAHLTQSQRAFVTECVNGTLRNLLYIDYVINQVSNTPVSAMKPFILCDLRTAVYQLLFLSGAPDYAVCNEAVELAKANGFQKLSGFVNGVLRSIIRQKNEIRLPDSEKYPIQYLSVKYSYQEWMTELFAGQFGLGETEEMLRHNNSTPDVSVCVNTLKTDQDVLVKSLEAEGVSVMAGRLAERSLRIRGSHNMTGLKAFMDGLFHVMDEGSMLAALSLDPSRDSLVIDLCSAPGGKAFLLSQIMENSGEILAFDIHEHKINLINQGAKRLNCSNIKAVARDATVADPSLTARADYVLVDAPCSGLGLARKKPDIKYTKTEADIKKLASIQRDILKTAAAYVKPGGALVYCTCTLSSEENAGNADWFCENFEFDKDDLTGFAEKYGLPPHAVRDGYITLLPQYMDTDGFFISRFVRHC